MLETWLTPRGYKRELFKLEDFNKSVELPHEVNDTLDVEPGPSKKTCVKERS